MSGCCSAPAYPSNDIMKGPATGGSQKLGIQAPRDSFFNVFSFNFFFLYMLLRHRREAKGQGGRAIKESPEIRI